MCSRRGVMKSKIHPSDLVIHALVAAAVTSEAVLAWTKGFDRLLVADDKTETTNLKYLLNSWSFFGKTWKSVYRRVSYFDYEGHVVINGDEIHGSRADIHAVMVLPGQKLHPTPNNEHNLWKDGEIKYYWYDKASEQLRSEMFNEAMRIWKAKLPWLQFTLEGYRTSSHALGPVVVQDVEGNLTTSSFGHTTKPAANYLLLGTTDTVRDYVHQIGHLLGLAHEHQRPDRHGYIELFCHRIRWTTKFNPKTGEHLGSDPVHCSPYSCTGYGCNFVPFDIESMNMEAMGDYDINSVMHIDFAACSSLDIDGNTLEPKSGIKFPPLSIYPSVVDTQRVCNLYPESCMSVCGNGIVEAGEECDDGNNDDNGGCTVGCTIRAAQVGRRGGNEKGVERS
ncbi:hypothetical protein BROUX41_005127 [Berkeleyomyces rouxiae]